MPVTVEHDIADHQDRGLIESRHGQLHGATHIQNEQGRDINTGLAPSSSMALARVLKFFSGLLLEEKLQQASRGLIDPDTSGINFTLRLQRRFVRAVQAGEILDLP